MKKLLLILLFFPLLFNSCGIPQEDYDKLKQENSNLTKENSKLYKENETLTSELDECLNGESRLISMINMYYSKKNYKQAKINITKLAWSFPQSTKNEEYKILLESIDEKIKLEKQKEDAIEKERIRLVNINNLGGWEVYNSKEYSHIHTKELIRGSFSNTATEDSKLDVHFMVNNYNAIEIKLFEYARNNPVKTNHYVEYEGVISISGSSESIDIKGTNYLESVGLDKSSSTKFHNLLKKGEKIMVLLWEKERFTSSYSFYVDGFCYENAYGKLKQ
jgi:hypothetical protein